jgi:hypothetical protein
MCHRWLMITGKFGTAIAIASADRHGAGSLGQWRGISIGVLR